MTTTMLSLSASYSTALINLFEIGGSGRLDPYGGITTGNPMKRIPGDPLVWLGLVARGLVAGESGLLILTESGRAQAEHEMQRLRG